MNKINDLLAALKTYSEINAIDIYIPSLKRAVKFKPLTGGQQKSFYNCLSDNVVFRTKFVLLTFNIIKENCLEDVVEDLTVLDRTVILLELRKNILGTKVTLGKDSETFTVDFDYCLNSALNITPIQERTVTIRNFEFVLETPRLINQYLAEKELRGENLEATASINKVVKDVIFTEVAKTIKEITLTDGAEKAVFNYSGFSFKEKISLVEALPADILIEVQKFLKDINAEQTTLLSIKVNDESSTFFELTPDFFLEG